MLLESTDIVRNITERNGGEILVSFFGHDGYFRIPDNHNREAIRRRLAESRDGRAEVHFSYDPKLNIHDIR